jgi:type IV/VI secretion system ImpK/VasF family protein
MARLLDGFSALFFFGLELDASLAAGHATPSAESALREALALLDAARAAAKADGKPAAQIESACFAVVAWLDEILARLPGAGDAAPPLQLALFNSSNAHSEFFHHLSALAADDDEVREVYWHALAQGFKGQYYFETDDSGELGKLKALHGRQLQVPPLTLDTLAHDRLTPQPYAMPDPPGPRHPQRRERALVQAGGALALLVPSAYLVWLLLGGQSAAPPPTPLVEQTLQSFACADLSVATAADGTTRVSGFVASAGDLARVQREVAALPEAKTTDFDLSIRAWPHCEVAAILKPYQARNRERGLGLQVQAPSAQDGRLREGDAVRLQVRGPAYDSHLRVDYYTSEGAVLHLTPDRGAHLAAGQKIALGKDMPSSWLVSPPFGTVLVAVLAAPAPFDETAGRPPFELASAYLTHLRESLAANPGGDRVTADFLFLETVER